MATWIRQGTGTAPTSFNADLIGNYALDNATAPGDFDPAGVTSVRTQWTITGSGFTDDSWDNVAGCALVGGGVEISQHPGEGSTNNQNVARASDHTDSTGIPAGLTVANWEAAFVRGDGVLDAWCLWNKVMAADGSTLTVSVLTVTITYTPMAAGSFTGTSAVIQDDQTSAASGTVVPPAFSGTSAATQDANTSSASGTAATPSATGTLAVTQDDQTSQATGDILKYAIFRRTPQTGAVFDPDVDTPIANVATSPYVDLNLSPAGYDYQVFRDTGAGWSTGSNVEQVTVTAGASTGTLAVTQDAQTSTASGTVTSPSVSGTSASTQDDQTSTASGSVVPPAFTGTSAATQEDDIASASGTVAPPEFTGIAAATQDAQTSTASGTVSDPSFTGTLDVTQQDQFSTASGTAVNTGISGSLAATQENQVAVASGTFTLPPITGTASSTQDDQTSNASGTFTAPAFSGTSASTQDDQTSSASGTVTTAGITGTLAVTQDDQTSTATGVNVPAFSGTLAVTQDDQVLSATGDVVGLTFWAPAPVAYVSAGVAYTPLDPDSPPPW